MNVTIETLPKAEDLFPTHCRACDFILHGSVRFCPGCGTANPVPQEKSKPKVTEPYPPTSKDGGGQGKPKAKRGRAKVGSTAKSGPWDRQEADRGPTSPGSPRSWSVAPVENGDVKGGNDQVAGPPRSPVSGPSTEGQGKAGQTTDGGGEHQGKQRGKGGALIFVLATVLVVAVVLVVLNGSGTETKSGLVGVDPAASHSEMIVSNGKINTSCGVFDVRSLGDYTAKAISSLNVRRCPSVKLGSKEFELNPGERVRVLQDIVGQDWVLVVTRKGQRGFVSSKYLRKEPLPALPVTCKVYSDAHGELNVRASPNGRKLMVVPHGEVVKIVETNLSKYRDIGVWAKIIFGRGSKKDVGWVFRTYLKCDL